MMIEVNKPTVVTMSMSDIEVEGVKEAMDTLARFKLMCEKFGTEVVNMETGVVIELDKIPLILGILDEFTSFRYIGEIVNDNPF